MDVKYLFDTNILTVPTTAVIGTDLWFERTGGDENHLEIVDLIEVFEGLIERCYATQYREDNEKVNLSGWETNTWTVTDVYSLSNSATDTEMYFNPYLFDEDEIVTYDDIVNSESYVPYVIPVSDKSGEYKTYVWDSQVWFKTPPMFPGYTQEYKSDIKYIIGQYDTLTISGFTGYYETLNGEYYYYDYDDWMMDGIYYHVYLQTDGGGELYFTPDKTEYFTYDGYYYFTKDFPPFITGVATEYYAEDKCTVSATKGDLSKIDVSNANSKSIIYDCPIIVRTPISGWLIPNRVDTWEKTLGTIDSWLLGDTINYNNLYTLYARFRTMLYPPCYYDSGANIDSDYEKMGFFIDPSKWDCDTYNRRFDLRIDVDSLFTNISTLGSIQQVAFPSPLTGNFYGFGDNKVISNNISGKIYPLTVAQNSHSLTKTMLSQRYVALKEMQYSLIGATGVNDESSVHWVNPDGGVTKNTFYGEGYGTSMTNAKTNALAYINWSSSNVRPYLYTACYKTSSSNYFYKMAGSKAVLKNEFMTNLFNSELIYYANSTAKSAPSTLTNPPKIEYEDWDEILIENKYKQFDDDTSLVKRSNSVSDVIVGDYDITSSSFNPSEPASTYQWSVKGFVVNGEDIMCKWSFNHCVKDI